MRKYLTFLTMGLAALCALSVPVQAAAKHGDERAEAELVEGVDLGQAVEEEEQHRAALRHGAVPGAGTSSLIT